MRYNNYVTFTRKLRISTSPRRLKEIIIGETNELGNTRKSRHDSCGGNFSTFAVCYKKKKKYELMI